MNSPVLILRFCGKVRLCLTKKTFDVQADEISTITLFNNCKVEKKSTLRREERGMVVK